MAKRHGTNYLALYLDSDRERMEDERFVEELHWAHVENREYSYGTPCD